MEWKEVNKAVDSVGSESHWCAKKPGGALIWWKRPGNPAGTGFVLQLRDTLKKGKLIPERINIEYRIEFCPFCGEKLERKPIK